uniref:Uncharacterized protein n=1 Tax=Mantoniella antarctica TaxID=81844 RepID=A0A7S0SB96_9CHLO
MAPEVDKPPTRPPPLPGAPPTNAMLRAMAARKAMRESGRSPSFSGGYGGNYHRRTSTSAVDAGTYARPAPAPTVAGTEGLAPHPPPIIATLV